MFASTEDKRERIWNKMRDAHCHKTESETRVEYLVTCCLGRVAKNMTIYLESEIAEIEAMICEKSEFENAEELEIGKAKATRYFRSRLKHHRENYERARADAAHLKAALHFEKTSELIGFYGSIFKEKPKPKKRTTASRSRKTPRR